MDLNKLKTHELREMDTAKLRETEIELRREMVTLRMDIYTAQSQSSGKNRGYRKSLARLLTVKKEQQAKQPAKQ